MYKTTIYIPSFQISYEISIQRKSYEQKTTHPRPRRQNKGTSFSIFLAMTLVCFNYENLKITSDLIFPSIYLSNNLSIYLFVCVM